MTYRGIISDGVVVLQDKPDLPDGTVVEVRPISEPDASLEALPAFGMWRDRKEMDDPAEASLTIRRQVERRGKDE
jgi:hypothetical protein